MQNSVINHIALVLDASGSMQSRARDVITVADGQIKYLAQRSKELDQETRVSVYAFSYHHKIECLIFDKDVLRMPSIAGLYRADGQTALVDATLKSIDDLKDTSTLYGDHSFLIYVLTDGQENDSRHQPGALAAHLADLPENWTLAAFVPNQIGVMEAKRFGFPKDNIAIWDTANAQGVSEVGETIRKATDSFMVGRSQGIRGSRSLFSLNTVSLSKAKQALTPMHFGQFRLLDVDMEGRIDEFIERKTRRSYKLGEAYYELMKPEKIQPQKQIVLLGKDEKLYAGPQVRALMGLPDYEVKVNPDFNPEYSVFVQSTSVNRKLLKGTKVVVMS